MSMTAEITGDHLRGFTPAELKALATALRALERTMRHNPIQLTSPSAVHEYLRLQIGGLPYEVFSILFLDAQNQLLAYEQMFRGSVTQTAVYPREVARRALQLNAMAIVCAHVHPSGRAEPSAADRTLTTALRTTLHMLDIRVLDHIIVAGMDTYSFAAHGLL